MEEVQASLGGRRIWLAPHVRMGEVNWYLECIIRCYQDVAELYNVHKPCITGGTDEPPGIQEIDHQDSRALDLRSRDFPRPEEAGREMLARLRFYSSRFIVKYLDVGFGAHFHVAWR